MDSIDECTALVPSLWRPGRKSSKKNPYQRVGKRGFVGRKDFRRPQPKVQRLGSKSKRSWGLRMPKIRIRILSPFALLARLRDAYVKMMMNFASRRSVVGLAMGPMGALKCPSRKIESTHTPNFDSTECIFTDAELMYIEYLKRDTAFMRSILMSS